MKKITRFLAETPPLTCKGFLWSTAIPICCLQFFYIYVTHVRLSLGRWPHFNEALDGWIFTFYDHAIRLIIVTLIGSLFVAPFIVIVCLCVRRWRHIAIYTIAYCASVGLAFGGMHLVPHAFWNWFMD